MSQNEFDKLRDQLDEVNLDLLEKINQRDEIV